VDAGVACAPYQDRVLRNLPCERVQVDEIWSFVYAKQAHVAGAKAAPMTAGDIWTWTAICADTKLIASFYIGDRGYGCTSAFIGDLKERLAGRKALQPRRLCRRRKESHRGPSQPKAHQHFVCRTQ
jgi:hypothetical protein